MWAVAKELARRAVPLVDDIASLASRLSSSRIVMLGEATHGTSEFYTWRRAITELLIAKHGFRALAIEGDWPPCHQVNKFLLSSENSEQSSEQLLVHSFKRWPPWMWANHEFKEMVQFLKEFNMGQDRKVKARLYGLDVYSMFDSMSSVLEETKKLDISIAGNASKHYAGYYKQDWIVRQTLGHRVAQETGASMVFQEVRTKLGDRKVETEAIFNTVQNARIVRNSESYYLASTKPRGGWDVRERHMMETLDEILERNQKLIVWAHNTHVGDYRATAALDQKSFGGLAREKYGEDQVSLVGFGTYQGSVCASSRWDGTCEEMEVPRAIQGSYEEGFHEAGMLNLNHIPNGNLYVDLKGVRGWSHPLLEWRASRGIGVVYEPSQAEQYYVPTMLAKRFDVFVFINSSHALHPL